MSRPHLHSATNTTEADIVYKVGLPPRTAPPDPMDCDFGMEPFTAGVITITCVVLLFVGMIVTDYLRCER